MSTTAVDTRLVGTSVRRVEDDRLLTGHGRFLDDIRLPGMLHAAFVRSPYAHARVLGVDVSSARAAVGVEAVFTGAEIASATKPLRIDAAIPGYVRPSFGALATRLVRHVGDPLAIVVARSRAAAEDAAELVLVDYDPLQGLATTEAALASDAPRLFEDAGTNLLFQSKHVHGDVDSAFAAADRVVRATFVQQRVTNVPMEGRGGVADFDPGSGELTYNSSTQSPHAVRFILAAALDHPISRIRVLAPDIGGGFGQKIPVGREEIALCAAARLLGKPVKWSEDRIENLTAAGHAREETVEAELALLDDGSILGMRARMTLDHGAYPCLPVPAPAYTESVRVMLPGGYRVPALAFEARIVATTKASYVPYRGPWAVECLVREALLDLAAAELGIDAIELRRRNLIPASEQPVKLVTGPTIDRVTTVETLERAVELVASEQLDVKGVLRGVGFAVLVEPAPGPPDYSEAVGFGRLTEPARARLEPDGRLTLVTAQAPHGQSHETTLAQLAADTLGVELSDVVVVHGDTRITPFHLLGTGGSRAATMASGAAIAAVGLLREKVLHLASAELGVAVDELDITAGEVRGGGRAKTLAEIASAAYFGSHTKHLEGEPGLQAAADYVQPDGGGWTTATHACVVEIDPATGIVRIPRYVVVEDCGRMINPAIVDGQIRGGVVQGIGQTLLEHAAYDEDGQFLTATFMDYLLPTATDAPTIQIEHLDPAGLDEHDFRGVGEGGTIAAPAALVNAVANALGVAVTRLPLDPERVLGLVDRSNASVTHR